MDLGWDAKYSVRPSFTPKQSNGSDDIQAGDRAHSPGQHPESNLASTESVESAVMRNIWATVGTEGSAEPGRGGGAWWGSERLSIIPALMSL